MKRVLGWIFNRWVLAAIVLLALALVIHIVGPMVSIGEWRPLESERARWITIGVLVAIVFAWMLVARWRAQRGNQAVVNQLIAAPKSGADQPAETPDMAAVRERFEKALVTLRRVRFGAGGLLSGWSAKLGGRYLYELPWYLIIGAPGSGKTTALRHSGLNFPLADATGTQTAIHGVGGTRNCDWWFTDRAVLIDTAGRFTTQDSDRENDRATWSGFLGLLKRSRPRQPLNGVLVTVSVTDLLTRSPAERAQHAATVRQRVQELHEDLGIRFPIYLLVTKSDLLAGFMDYFATVDKDQRATPWGFTFPLQAGGKAALQGFGPEFDALRQRLTDGLIDRLQTERDAQRRSRIYGFPTQFAGLRPMLQEFVNAVFSPSPYEADPLLRGVYFISGTQEGTPIDRVLGAVARSYRLERAVIAPNQASGKSYFLNRLLGEVVFAEAGLGGTNPKWERRRTVLAAAGYAAVGVVSVGLVAMWSTSYVNNRRYVADVAARSDDVRKLLQATPNRATADILPIVPALNATRGLAGQLDDVPWSLGYGLFQGHKLDSAARAAYQRMLADAVLPRLALRIEEQLRQSDEAPETQYEALKAYLMLHDPEHFDAETLQRHIEADLDNQRRELTPDQRAQLSAHLGALLSQGAVVSPIASDKDIVTASRLRLASLTLPQRIYNRMRYRGLGQEFPEFNAVRAAGNNAALVFTRASGAPLTQGVPGLYTRDGYHRGFEAQVDDVADELAREQGWVLGVAEPQQDAATVVRGGRTPADDARRLYLDDYAATWEAYIADIRLQPMTSLAQSVQMSRLLSAPDSPLPLLMKAISRETTLAGGESVVDKASDKAAGVVRKSRDRIADLLSAKPAAGGSGTAPRPESVVDDRFAGLRFLVSSPQGGKAPLDDTLGLIAEVNVLLNAVATAIQGGSAPPASPLPNRVKAEAARMPQPLRAMLDNLSQSSANASQLGVRQNLGQEVRAQVGEFCQQAVAGRYPLDRTATRDATQADFAMLFGPGGKIDQLFQQKLAPYVDTTTRPWKFRPVEGTPLGLDGGSLPQFQRAAAIRETFFPAGNAPSLRLEFKPIEMDASLTQFILDVDGQIVRYAHGPQIPMAVQWPGPRGSSQVRVQVSPPSASGSPSGMVTDGPWALFRLFERVKIDPTSAPERFRATFDVDGRKAVFEVTTSSVRNPFRLRELNEFACPAGL
ncbi:type VI secretion system membrane subunit TssM [Ideonella sp.]|uniref:type VI secretion system membrane subunit TssM n=1 Tax=Ideonella sp. TaxID=1929293 RepID=UPI0035B175D4